MSNHDCHGHHDSYRYGVSQSLDELAFEKGIWGAALDGNVEKLKSILSRGEDPSICDPSGYTALHYAARNGKEDICKILLEHGANPNAQTHGGATPLHRAAFVALHKAAQRLHFEVCQMLVTAKPELLNMKDKNDLKPFQYVKENNVCLLSLLNHA
ncbi:ankyrin repeat domain-containing protein 39 [Caerostris extrusa]|uniref:Ankyrin repeat domain-containing protein 39 n=1 Tax=Caerostris extrusa TaxID=172846 RepID=A0AAV4W096_CAEEX|nr:ankyrin repeat domain-containing protein 39 [Caerostris extrusa]